MVPISELTAEKDFKSRLLDLHNWRLGKGRRNPKGGYSIEAPPHKLFAFNNGTLMPNLEILSQQLRKSILEFGSETPDNLACVSRIEYGYALGVWGIKIAKRELPFSLVAKQLIRREKKLFAEAQNEFLDLTENDWKAAMSFAWLLLCDLEKPFGLSLLMDEAISTGANRNFDQQFLHETNERLQALLTNVAGKTFFGVDLNNVLENIELSTFENPEIDLFRFGVKVKGYVFLSDIFNQLEETAAPPFVHIQKDWQAFNRLMTLILVAFEENRSLF